MASVPLHLVTGFLGSGKTTFLMHYLDTFGSSRKIGVVQNEFSASGHDGVIVRQHEGLYQMIEINNGSVFCVCLLGSFIRSLTAFIDDYSPDEIVMEVSGMSDPVSIGQLFQSESLRNKVYLGYIWTLVDARNFHRVSAIRARLEHQIRIADTVVINKSDAAGGLVETVTDAVKRINPYASIQVTSYAQIGFDMKKNPLRLFYSGKGGVSTRPDLQSVVIKSSRTISPENLKKFIEDVKCNFVRFKGYANIGNQQKMIVQGVFDDYSFTEVTWFHGVTELVGIGHFPEKANFTEIFTGYCC